MFLRPVHSIAFFRAVHRKSPVFLFHSMISDHNLTKLLQFLFILGFLYSTCREDGAIPVTFEDYDSMLYIEGAQFSRRGGETYLADLSRNREVSSNTAAWFII